MYELDKSGHCVYSLHYHLIIVIKYRQQVFTDLKMINDLQDIIEQISKTFDVVIIEQECGIDHIHILFKSKPTLDMTKFINVLKGHSSRDIRKKYKDFLKDKLWGDHFWNPSYFLASTGNVSIDILKEYIENQRTLQEN